MLAKNFPGRRNERRQAALNRLKINFAKIKETSVPKELKDKKKKSLERVEKEIKILESRILEPALAKGLKTKKYRG